MKKLFSIITLFMLLLGCLTLPTAATDDYSGYDLEVLTDFTSLSEDMQVLTIYGKTYHRMDLSAFDLYNESGTDLYLSASQQEQIKHGFVLFDTSLITAQVTLEFKDGSSMSMFFINDAFRSQVETLMTSEDINGQVQFYWPNEYVVTAPLSDFRGTPVTVSQHILNQANEFAVNAKMDGLELQYQKGTVLEEKGVLYYVDFKENGIEAADYYKNHRTSLEGYEITDEALKAELTKYIQAYYDDGVGVFYDDDFTEKLSTGVLIFLFGVVPLGILILAVVLARRSKGYQRITWIVTGGLSSGTLAVFLLIARFLLRL